MALLSLKVTTPSQTAGGSQATAATVQSANVTVPRTIGLVLEPAVGQTGPAGPQGVQGDPGVTANFRNPPEWDSTISYSAGPPPDAVLGSDGQFYYSVVTPNLNHNPVGDSGVHWASGLASSVVSDIRSGGATPVDSTGVGDGAAQVYDAGAGKWKPDGDYKVSKEAPLNPQWAEFGAKGDGIANDTTALQAAINALPTYPSGGELFIPPGTYLVTSSLAIAYGQTIRGAGSEASILVHKAGANPLISAAGAALGSPSGVCLRDFNIDGPNGNTGLATGTGDGIRFNGTGGDIINNVEISNVAFRGVGDATHHALYATWTLEAIISKCLISACQGEGIHLDVGCNAAVIRDNLLSNGGFGTIGVNCIQANGVLVEGNVIEAWRGAGGLVIDGCTNASLIRNWFEDNNGVQITVGNVTQTGNSTGCVLIGNNDSPNGSTTASLDTPTNGSGGVQDLTCIANDFRSTVLIKPRTAGAAVYFFAGGQMIGSPAYTSTLTDADTLAFHAVRGVNGISIPRLPRSDPGVAGQIYSAGTPSAGVPKALMVSGG